MGAQQQEAALTISALLPNVPDRWDDDDDDEGSDGRIRLDGADGVNASQQKACHASGSIAQPVSEDLVLAVQHVGSQKGSPCDGVDRQSGQVRLGSSHSRLRKDLVNL